MLMTTTFFSVPFIRMNNIKYNVIKLVPKIVKFRKKKKSIKNNNRDVLARTTVYVYTVRAPQSTHTYRFHDLPCVFFYYTFFYFFYLLLFARQYDYTDADEIILLFARDRNTPS